MIDASDVVLAETNVSVEVFGVGFGILLDLFNISIDVSPDLLLDFLELSLGSIAIFEQ